MAMIPFAVQSYKSLGLPISVQRTVNAYAETEPANMKTPVAVFGAPGITTHTTCGTGPIRGFQVMNGIAYAVSGMDFYEFDTNGVATLRGTGILGSAPVGISNNGLQVVIVNGAQGYTYDQATTTFLPIVDPDFNPANTVTFFDSFMVFDWVDTNKFFISAPLDATDYDPLDFASAEVQPDLVIGVMNQLESLLIFGEHSIETWFDAGAVDFPFQRYDGATVERGCIAPLSIIKEDNSVFFLGDDGMFYRLNGVLPVRVSTHAIEQEWATYDTIEDAYAFSYTVGGHKFVTLSFASGDACWVYDIATGLWHERESIDPLGNATRWRGICTCQAYGKTFIGDLLSGKVGFIDATVYTEFDDDTIMRLVSPTMHNDRKRLFMSRFELDVQTGVGLANGQGSDPQVMLRFSNDGGATWNSYQPWQSMGALGAYTKRLRWLRLGQARSRVIEVSISDPVKRVVVAAHADLSVGM